MTDREARDLKHLQLLADELEDPFEKRGRRVLMLCVTMFTLLLTGLLRDPVLYFASLAAIAMVSYYFWTYIGWWDAYAGVKAEAARIEGLLEGRRRGGDNARL